MRGCEDTLDDAMSRIVEKDIYPQVKHNHNQERGCKDTKSGPQPIRAIGCDMEDSVRRVVVQGFVTHDRPSNEYVTRSRQYGPKDSRVLGSETLEREDIV